MLLRCLSDLHLEFGDLDLPELPDDHKTVLVLAGDIGLASKPYTYVPFLESLERFSHVIYILGNHEYYNGSFANAIDKIKKNINHLVNVDVLNDDIISFSDDSTETITLVCATLWTDMNKCDPLVIHDAERMMNDYRLIRNGPSDTDAYKTKLRAIDTIVAHKKSKQYIFDQIKTLKPSNKVVVVTHHLPCDLSIPEMFRGDSLNGAYVTDLSNEILDTKPDLWLHGHVHNSFDYMLGDTRVVCNPRGYYNQQLNPDFDPSLVIEV